MVKRYPLEADTKVNAAAICSHEHTTLKSKQFHASAGCYLNKTFILCNKIHEIHEQSIFPRSSIFVFNSTIDSLYLTD